MQIIAGVLYLAVLVYLLLLITRLVLEWIQSYAREYRPSGLVLVLFELVYTLTDPPVLALRRLIPPPADRCGVARPQPDDPAGPRMDTAAGARRIGDVRRLRSRNLRGIR